MDTLKSCVFILGIFAICCMQRNSWGQDLGSSCGTNVDCTTTGAVCDITCKCDGDHYKNDTVCEAKKTHGSECQKDDECENPLTCVSTNVPAPNVAKRCLCPDGHYWSTSPSTCSSVVLNLVPTNVTVTTNLTAATVTWTSTEASGYTDNFFVKYSDTSDSQNSTSSSASPIQISGLTHGTTYSFVVSRSITAQERVQHGIDSDPAVTEQTKSLHLGPCTSDVDCNDYTSNNIICKTSAQKVCICKDNFYFDQSLPCVPIDALKPTITLSSIYNSITVNWTALTAIGYTSSYELYVNGTPNGSHITSDTGSLTISGTSATTYSIYMSRSISGQETSDNSVNSDTKTVTTKTDYGSGCTSGNSECRDGLECHGSVNKCLCADGWFYTGNTPCTEVNVLRPYISNSSSDISTITVHWGAASAADYNNTYTASVSPGGQPPSPVSATPLVIKNLDESTTYTITITGTITRYGRSQPTGSDSVIHRTKTSHNSTCSSEDVCFAPEGTCLDDRCLCNQGFYWRTTSCVAISELRPSSVTEFTKTTSSLTVNWTITQDKVPYIAQFDVVATHATQGNVSSVRVSSSETTGTVTGLVPGAKYNVTVKAITSYENRHEKVPSDVTVFRTKPEKVSGLVSPPTKFESPNMTIAFNKVVGEATVYIVRLKGITDPSYDVERQTTYTGGPDLIVEVFNNVMPSDEYTLTITANSAGVLGEEYLQRIKVGETPPGIVTEFTVLNTTSRSAHVSWKKPAAPNGLIFEYALEIYDGEICVMGISVNCSACERNATNFTRTGCNEADVKDIAPADIEDQTFVVDYNITGLYPLIFYEVKVAAINAAGTGTAHGLPATTETEAAGEPKDFQTDMVLANSVFLSWKPPEPRPGVTRYFILTDEWDGNDFSRYKNDTVVGWNETKLNVTDLSSYWRYRFTIQASTIVGSSELVNLRDETITEESPPEQVVDLRVEAIDQVYDRIRLLWQCPYQKDGRNGVIRSANLDYYSNLTTVTNGVGRSTVIPDPGNCAWAEEVSVTAEYPYIFEVSLNNEYEGKMKAVFHIVPGGPPSSENTPPPAMGTPTLTTTTVIMNPKLLLSRRNGEVTKTGAVVCPHNRCGPARRKRALASAAQYDDMKTWKDVQGNGFQEKYRATKDNWLDGEQDSDRYQFTIGKDTTCAGLNSEVFCNGPLPENTKFSVIVFACTKSGCTESDAVTVETLENPPPVAAIAGGIAAAIVVILIVIAVVWWLRRRPRSTNKTPYTLEEEGELITRKRPIKIIDFEERVEQMHKDSNLLFSEEFEDIGALSSKHACLASETGGNKLKNRYVNILAFDHSRVKLLPIEEDDEETDYINANYIPGFKSPREYIATQGPMTGTVSDFWRMIWEQHVPIIVMLSDLQEKGKPKVDRYWPENIKEPVQYGDNIVEMTNYSPLSKYIIRIFKATLGDESRLVRHYFLPGWQDYSANLTPDDVINFVKSVRMEMKPNDTGPILVHCSAGVGRTGTYISLDVFQQMVDAKNLNDEIDIFDFVLKMRNNRSYMVQTEKQYIFIHDTIKEIIEKKKEELKSKEENIYQNGPQADNTYANMAFQPDEEMYMNVDIKPGQPTTVL